MKKMFGRFPLPFGGGVNPPHAPSYPLNWEAEQVRLDIHVEVDTDYVQEILSHTPFKAVGNRAIFRYLDARGHTLASHTNGFNETVVVLPIRYKDMLSTTYIYHYTSDEIANIAGRELLGYSKKDADTELHLTEGDHKWGRTMRRDELLTEFDFQVDDSVAPVKVVKDGPQPDGAIHMRRLPYPDRPDTAYADIIFRRYRFTLKQELQGRATLKLYESEWDPIARLKPKVIGATFAVGDFGGGADSEERRLLEVVTVPDIARTVREPALA